MSVTVAVGAAGSHTSVKSVAPWDTLNADTDFSDKGFPLGPLP